MLGGSSNPFWKCFLAVAGIPSTEGPRVLVVSAEIALRAGLGPARALLWCCLLDGCWGLLLAEDNVLLVFLLLSTWALSGRLAGNRLAGVQSSHQPGRAKWCLLARERVLLHGKVTFNSGQRLRQAWRGTVCTA